MVTLWILLCRDDGYAEDLEVGVVHGGREWDRANLCDLEHLVAGEDELIEAVDGRPCTDGVGGGRRDGGCAY